MELETNDQISEMNRKNEIIQMIRFQKLTEKRDNVFKNK